MILRKIYELPDGKSLRYPIVIVSDNIETFKYVYRRNGSPYYRHRPNHYTEAQWAERCATTVSSNKHGDGYDPSCDGIQYCYFAYHQEGDPTALLGEPASTIEKEISRRDHLRNRDSHNAQMKDNMQVYLQNPEFKDKMKEYQRNYRNRNK